MTNTFINHFQSKATRRLKYAWVKSCGFCRCDAERLKDWSHRHIIQYMNVNLDKINHVYGDEKEQEKIKEDEVKQNGC
jgi:hypothetical protein